MSRVPEIRRCGAAVADCCRVIQPKFEEFLARRTRTNWHHRCDAGHVQIRRLTSSESRGRKNWSIRVLGPYAPVNSDDLDRVFSGNGTRPVGSRLERLTACSKIVVLHDSRVVGVVAYENHADELRVHELAVAPETDCRPEKIVDVALDALELACLAGGARRLVVTSRAGTFRPPLWRRGFVRIDEGCAGSWLEKIFR